VAACACFNEWNLSFSRWSILTKVLGLAKMLEKGISASP
jgi:hypothetical protein